MSGQSVNASVDFRDFSRSISICICIRILGMFSSLFMVISSLSFLLCYGLLQSSKYIDQFISQLNEENEHTITTIKKMTNATIISIGNSMLGVLMPWNIDLTIIKEEVSTLYENIPVNCESSSDDEPDTSFVETDSSNNNINVDDNTSNDSGDHSDGDSGDHSDGDTDGDSDGDDSNKPASVSDVSTIQTHISNNDDDNMPDDGNNFRSITPNITEQEQKEQEPETPDIEDITQQRMAEIKIEREKQKANNLMDISSESD
jgi:hypothetical protein